MRKIFLVFVCGILSLLLCSCNNKDNNNLFIIGTSADNPPYEFLDQGKVTGFDIEFAEFLSKKMKKNIEIRNMDFPGLIPALIAGHLDAVIAGLSETDERKQSVDFSNQYSESRIAVIYKKISGITNIESLKDKRIGSQLGTTWEVTIKKILEKFESAHYVSMTNNLALVEELKNDRIHAVVLEKKQAERFLNQYPEFDMMLLDAINISNFAIALQKNSKYLEDINKAIEELKADGTIEALQNKWLNN